MAKVRDYAGLTFGSLTAIKPLERVNTAGSLYWEFKCVCGNFCEKVAASIARQAKLAINAQTPSCGCTETQIKKETAKKYRSTHNLSNHKLYRIRRAMINRCYNLNSKSYKDYGLKGVYVCDEWLANPVSFINWALENGWNDTLEIDKDIKVPGNMVYSPDTCLLVSKAVNNKHSHSRDTSKGKHIKLSLEDVDNIINMYKTNEFSQHDIAIKFNVTRSAIQRILNMAGISRNFK